MESTTKTTSLLLTSSFTSLIYLSKIESIVWKSLILLVNLISKSCMTSGLNRLTLLQLYFSWMMIVLIEFNLSFNKFTNRKKHMIISWLLATLSLRSVVTRDSGILRKPNWLLRSTPYLILLLNMTCKKNIILKIYLKSSWETAITMFLNWYVRSPSIKRIFR